MSTIDYAGTSMHIAVERLVDGVGLIGYGRIVIIPVRIDAMSSTEGRQVP